MCALERVKTTGPSRSDMPAPRSLGNEEWLRAPHPSLTPTAGC
jgi:hypothetical protein